MQSNVFYRHIESPVGALLIAGNDAGLRLIEFQAPRHPMRRGEDWHEGDHVVLRDTQQQLGEYFAGKRRGFELPLAPQGTQFQCQVWLELANIPFGGTISYAELALRVHKPTATRAVGAANGRNPIPIVLPCHRVIGADGSLTGFGGGLPTKKFLLQLEGAMPRQVDLFA
ncbi:methylated-DNA--protein-cysteine methyltransferase [Myxococcus stipitatus DSM 14675]|uniref:Methylated-DNA--protein-cysteine methyltransferase n=1 Tax=Myxococcus stipitatus (strain DSM 14675 / JCM 12634 / Mx s8) TaxID=1278073 RepID=L7U5U4_MYXSD|nr:methylated-DNA--[protein]-cysteine S-methyltransferase [Myxococcus stipitatus]AGC43468.1 methylated-DNA--protein-cysteine methyltransferase [Myxococcus stipitatus DSM 14675]